MADKPRESPVIKPEDFEYEPEVVDWSRLLERDIPEEELPRWARAIRLGNEQQVRDIIREAKNPDEEERKEVFSRDEILMLDWKIEQLKSTLTVTAFKLQELEAKEGCAKCRP